MLSSGSDASPEASPARTTPPREQGDGEQQASSDHAGDRDDPAQNKDKTLKFTRRKNSKKGRSG